MSRTFEDGLGPCRQPYVTNEGILVGRVFQYPTSAGLRTLPVSTLSIKVELGYLKGSLENTSRLDEVWGLEYLIPLTQRNLIVMCQVAQYEGDEGLGEFASERLKELLWRRRVIAIARAARVNLLPAPERGKKHKLPTLKGRVPEFMLEMQEWSPYPLYSTQLAGSWALYEAKHLGLFFDMRVGKTASALTAAARAYAEGSAEVVIVMAPTSNLYNPWIKELQQFFKTESREWDPVTQRLRLAEFPIWVLDGNQTEDEDSLREILRHGRGAIIVSYDRAPYRAELLMELTRARKTFLIGDETSQIKNATSKRGRFIDELIPHTAYSTALNGTPVEQGFQDLYSQLRICDPWMLEFGSRSWENFEAVWLKQEGSKYRPSHPRLSGPMIKQVSLRWMQGESDQYYGDDKSRSFRWRRLPITAEQKYEMDQAKLGFLRKMEDLESQGITGRAAIHAIALVCHLRQIAAGHTKMSSPIEDDAKYIPLPLRDDPKLLIFLAWLVANPDASAFVTTEFVAQDQILKEELDKLGIPWSGTSPLAPRTRMVMPPSTIPRKDWEDLKREVFLGRAPLDWEPDTDYGPVTLPDFMIQPSQIAVRAWGKARGWKFSEVEYLTRPTPYPPHVREEQIEDFNEGRARVFIMRASQGKGFSLAQMPVLERGGLEPEMFILSPTWSVGDFDQSINRGVAQHPLEDRSTRTVINVLYHDSTVEGEIISALKNKKDFQKKVLDDIGRVGYTTFVDSLFSSSHGDGEDEEELFDIRDIRSRLTLGLPPFVKLSPKQLNKVKASSPDEKDALTYLRSIS